MQQVKWPQFARNKDLAALAHYWIWGHDDGEDLACFKHLKDHERKTRVACNSCVRNWN